MEGDKRVRWRRGRSELLEKRERVLGLNALLSCCVVLMIV